MDEATRGEMDRFFGQHEQRAFLIAVTMTQNRDDALELVQDSMLKLVQNYPRRDPDEWPPLFHRILQNRIRDWLRRQKFRQAFASLMPWSEAAEQCDDKSPSAELESIADENLARIVQALKQLPLRQQQTFLLRAWQEMNTRETAFVLSISENSVKTHYARALKQMKLILGETDDG